MKKYIFLLATSFLLVIGNSAAQTTDTAENGQPQIAQAAETTRYKLYPTQNMWNFIKLDTQTGKMWMVQFSVEDSNDRFVYDLNPLYLYFNDDMVNGRFELYPTQNSWNFILLDQIDGRTCQVQWSFDKDKRGIVPIM